MITDILILTIVFEAITAFFRFGLKKQSTRDTQVLSKFTFGYRIHHGYIGVVMLIGAFILPSGEYAYYAQVVG